MPLIQIKNLTYQYKRNKNNNIVTAIDDLSCEFKDKAFNVIVGPSGCGKTTLLRIIASLLEPYEGEILTDFVNIKKFSVQEGHLVLNSPLKAGSVVNFDLQFVGNASAEDEVKVAFYAYGGDENGNKIERGQMGDPTTAKVTRKQIRDWYYGQGANNLTAYDMTEWNDGHILLSMNILEDCSTVVMMMEFGRKAVKDDQGQPTGAFVEDKSLWENNKWVINSIHLNIADYDLVKPEYQLQGTSSRNILSQVKR